MRYWPSTCPHPLMGVLPAGPHRAAPPNGARLPEAPAQFRPRAGIQQPEPYFLRSQARGPDQRRVLPCLLKIEVRPRLDQHFDEPQFLAFWQHAVAEHVRNVVEWMGSSAPILPPTDQLIGRTGASASMRRKAVASPVSMAVFTSKWCCSSTSALILAAVTSISLRVLSSRGLCWETHPSPAFLHALS